MSVTLVPGDYARLVRASSLTMSVLGDAAYVRYFWQDGAWQRRVMLIRDQGMEEVTLGGRVEKCPAFSPDGSLLWFLSDGGVAVHGLSSGRTCPGALVPEGFEAVDVLPLSRGCLFVCRREIREKAPEGCDWQMPLVTESLHFRSDADHGFTRRYVYRLCLSAGEKASGLRLLSESNQPFRALAVLPDESAVLYFRDGFRLLSLPGGVEREVPSSLVPFGEIRPAIAPDGSYALVAVCTEGMEIAPRRLWLDGREHDEDVWVGEPAGLTDGAYMDTSPERKTLISAGAEPGTFLVSAASDHTPGLWRLSVTPGRVVCQQLPFPGLVTEVAGESSRGVQVLLGDLRRPPEPVWLSGGKVVPCGPALNAWLEDASAVSCTSVSVPSQDGRAELTGLLLTPPDPQPRLPLLVWVHGGPSGYWAPGFNLEVFSAVAAGFAVLLPNPRGSTGRGNAYAAPDHAFDGGAAGDILCLLDHVLRAFHVLDGRSVSVLGGSYGGYMAAWLAGATSRFRCAVVIKAVTNWLFIHFNSSQAGQSVIDDYRDFQDFLVDTLKSSPVYLAGDVNIPVLIIHGEKDQQVPVENAHQYYTALKDCHPDLPVRLMLLPDACHGLSREVLPDYLAVQRETLAWLNRYGKEESL